MTTERKNISQPADWWAAFEDAADAQGLSLSEWMGRACLAKLNASERKLLSERPPAHRPPADT